MEAGIFSPSREVAGAAQRVPSEKAWSAAQPGTSQTEP